MSPSVQELQRAKFIGAKNQAQGGDAGGTDPHGLRIL